MKNRYTIISILMLLGCVTAQAQISIGGNVYGGGNAGKTAGSTSVTVHAGDLNAVFGGARMANVEGSAFVHIDGEHASNYIVINKVYGGNDIAGSIGTSADTPTELTEVGTEKGKNNIDNTWNAFVRISTKTVTTGTGDEAVTTEAEDAKKIYIGQLFGGGNGDYYYYNNDDKHEIYKSEQDFKDSKEPIASNPSGFILPDLGKTYLEILGGSIVYAYGGGNNATITERTVIALKNPSKVVTSIKDATNPHADNTGELLTDIRFEEKMGINATFSYPKSDAYQIGRLFGGNNKADMATRPRWNLQEGKVRNLYGGGNEGRMTSPEGLLLQVVGAGMVVDNVYGGCRKADVKPLYNNNDKTPVPYNLVQLPTADNPNNIPAGYASRVRVVAGHVNNVYGGNDISGNVYGGNTVGVMTHIYGDVYGGGNGSYAYTDNEELKDDPHWSDFYYDPDEVFAAAGVTAPSDDDLKSVTALNLIRPNAEKVSILVRGTEDNPTIVDGGLYVGGNSASLREHVEGASADDQTHIKIGSHVIIDKVFLGNNGENMIRYNEPIAGHNEGVLRTFARTDLTPDGSKFNSMDLTKEDVFAKYMEGCAMKVKSVVVFENKSSGDAADYIPYSTMFGSVYGGGNVGSMTDAGSTTLNLNQKVIVYNKLVGGCNNAFVKATDFNAAFEGGLMGTADPENGNKLVLNISNLKIQPMRWAVARAGEDGAAYDTKLTDDKGNYTYLLTTGDHPHRYLEWNTVDSRYYDVDTKTYREMPAADPNEDMGANGKTSTDDDKARRLFGGNIYGGCYSSGIVAGNVVINLNADVEERTILFDEVKTDELGEEESLYGSDQTVETDFTITKRNTGVILGQQGMDVFGSALNVFGGGKGKDTEIWGSTTININRGFTFQAFGGSEEGVIGKPLQDTAGRTRSTSLSDYTFNEATGEYAFNGRLYKYDGKYSCYVNLCGKNAGVSKASDSSEDMAESDFIYGGGFFGPVCGNTVINLGKGRVFNTFGGSCNGDILGTARTYIGRQVKDEYKTCLPSNETNHDVFEPGFPWIRDIIYGANDLGGRILGEANFKSQIRGVRSDDPSADFDVYSKIHNPGTKETPDVLMAGAYVEYLQGRTDAIFGGCYGTYDYSDRKFARYTDDTGEPLIFNGTSAPKFFKPRLNNAIVNFRPTYTNSNNVVNQVYGAGQGYSGEKERDLMQNRSYVLIDIPQTSEYAKFTNMEVFGAGAWGGVGMGVDLSGEHPNYDSASAIVDLVRGEIGAAYGASYEEGVTRRTLVNVPQGSTIRIGSIFGGGYGTSTYLPCDAYEANVEYHSADACLIYNPQRKDDSGNTIGNALQKGAIYGGNNSERRTLYGKINIDVPVRQDSYKHGMTTGTVYGAGYGGNTWSEYTEVNLNRGASVWEVYGGGEAGKVYNAESVHNFMTKKDNNGQYVFKPAVWPNTTEEFTDDDWDNAWKIGGGIWPVTTGKAYWQNTSTSLACPLVRVAESDDRDFSGLTGDDLKLVQNRYCTNVLIHEGAYVGNYAYGAGLGAEAVVAGTTYIALLGGEVRQDIYAAGTSGSVEDTWNAGAYDDGSVASQAGFTPSANVYIEGGTVRNVYGGGWRGHVGKHVKVVGGVESDASISEIGNNADDRLGETHVVIGKKDGTSHVDGIPSITRNVYGGGEGGAIYGDAYVTINNGYIGYRYNSSTGNYDEELEDSGKTDEAGNFVPNTDLEKGGNVFGGGYVANSYTDRTHVTMWGGVVRGCLFGGGEIGPVGRGTVKDNAPAPTGTFISDDPNNKAKIYKGGETHVILHDGHVMRNIFGGGRGYDNWGGEGWMSEEETKTIDRSSKGFVFGTTDVHIRGGEVGTDENALHGYGNIFGGGDEGFVYSSDGKKKGTPVGDDDLIAGLPNGGGGYYYKDGDISKGLSLCCNVVVEPWCKVKPGESITLSSKTFNAGEYVPVEYLAYLRNKSAATAEWDKLDTRGVTIHNAVFAGGNITPGSDLVYANTVTVFGNAAASLRDVYNRDLISVGTDDIGGLYGDGNMTRVDGFRELHIDNYGTDFYSLSDKVDWDTYDAMSNREKAYYQLKYIAKSDHTYEYYESQLLHVVNGTAYKKGQKVTKATWESFNEEEQKNWYPGQKEYKEDDQIDDGEYGLMDLAERENWDLGGVFSKYAGRPLNTIQRADFCGVFGSRMVLKGAEDRASKITDYANYTINRVDELSLNQNRTLAAGDEAKDTLHGNYFGIYSSVKFLGNLTSDVFFTEAEDVRLTDTSVDALKGDDTTTYYQWKAAKPQSKYRNNGTSYNKVALASGVHLEIKREETETAGEDKWGHVSGVIELDLINVMPGMGGGFVYAKNEHGAKTHHSDYGKVSVLDYNEEARTYRRYTYDETDKKNIETSGNFVHNTKEIVDDCYPSGGMYKDAGYVKSPAHYWYIKGSIYVYDQYISAYTGSATAYAERIELPLTITAAANGRMTLREVQPNYYAYYDKNGNKLGTVEETFKANDKVYRLNDPISYWDYRLLSEGDKAKFVEETYVTSTDCKVGNTPYAEGSVLTAAEHRVLKDANPTVTIKVGDANQSVPFDEVFHMSNNMSHNTGYVLTYDVNNPMVWNDYYTKITSPGQANSLDSDEYKEGQKNGETINRSDYTEGPTFKPKASGVYGQQAFKQGDIITANTYAKYQSIGETRLAAMRAAGETDPTKKQATVSPARVMTSELSVTDSEGHEIQRLYAGTPIAEGLKYINANGNPTAYTPAQWTAIVANSAAAKVCTSYMEFTASDYVYAGQLLSPDDIETLILKVKEKFPTYSDTQVNTYITEHTSDAYYCVDPGLYGGSYFEKDKAYRAIDTWSAMNETDRANFAFNYDAFDVLIDPTFSDRLESNYGQPKVQYDGYKINTTNPLHDGDTPLATKLYSPTQKIDYQAEYTGEDTSYKDENNVVHPITKPASESEWLSRTQFEKIPNEKHHYSPITVNKPGTCYVINTSFMRGDIPYSVGQLIEEKDYEALNEQQRNHVDAITFTDAHIKKEEGEYVNTNYFYCREPYTVNEKGEGVAVTTMGIKSGTSATTYNINDEVPKGVIINQAQYDALKNYQAGFLIHGLSPMEVSTLYVSSESNIEDLTKEKIITVIYLYEYEESDESGFNVTPVSERHIVNIHVNFKSGVPEIGELNKPSVVLPGTTIGLDVPSVSEGAFRVTSSGWELFSNQSDAETHYNGMPYYNTVTPVYWYQNNYWIAYYAETNHGRAYSNSVQVSVANYHDLKKVMDDKQHHYYIDHKDVDREPKIYLNDYSTEDPETSQSGLDMLKNLIDLSYLTSTSDGVTNGVVTAEGALNGHALLNTSRGTMRGGNFLEFFVRADQKPKGESWTPIANNTGECFEGILHGDGHTISGLDNSLFNHLCGSVYNLGVTGSFTGAGVAETGEGYVENCWVNTSGTPTKGAGHYAVFGNPSRLSGALVQVVNCYYPESDAYTVPTGDAAAHGVPINKPDNAFYNGEVAYDLNGFYLYKRYADKQVASGTAYKYYEVNDNNTLTAAKTKYYATADAIYCSSGVSDAYTSGYVEDRFADGDFVYADGSIPGSNDERLTVVEDKNEYYPIWPHDYIFFGQTLSYDHMDGKNGRDPINHQPLPSVITKSNNRIQTDINSNRVYRAPAYFRSKQMGVAHFNPHAVFAQSKKDDATLEAHKDMTAIDFTGYNDMYEANGAIKAYGKGVADGKFYPPLLDEDGLQSIYNADLTRNLLVYTMTSTAAAAQTNGVVANYLHDEPYTETDNRYHTVEGYDIYKDDIRGHRVQKQSNGTFLAMNDHLLIDKQDFNAPFAYSFADGKRMWYQRKPDNYVGMKKDDGTYTDSHSGWNGISLPFKADIVTTNVKGEITHFYSGSATSANSDSKVGHEYWLRELATGGKVSTSNANVFEAVFNYPAAKSTDGEKEYKNTFLWDYYYSWNNRDDLNKDDYQTYYKADENGIVHTFESYPRLAAATPYIIGFPGERYYEFDLSGNFEALTAKDIHPEKLEAQTITFASKPGETSIGVSDDEANGKTDGGYTFMPTYMNNPTIEANTNVYQLDSDGDSFNKTASNALNIIAFRPYFTAAAASGARQTRSVEQIVFGLPDSKFGAEKHGDPSKGEASESLTIYALKHKIAVESALNDVADVRIVNTAGQTIASFEIQPGERVETRIYHAGVYIVQSAGGRYLKKLAVK